MIVVLTVVSAGLSAVNPSGTLPIVHITTNTGQPVTDRDNYVTGTIYIDNCAAGQTLGTAASPKTMSIRGRGNYTWTGFEKKPYKIKLAEKAPLLGMNKHKHWALLRFYEPTVAGLQLGNIMGMDWTASTRPVEVILNGDYQGLYLLTETNRIGKQRLNIYEQPNWNEDVNTIPYGWLVEVDNYIETNQIKIAENNKWTLQVTYHSPDSLSLAQRSWLIEDFKAMNAAIYDADKTNSTWEQKIDVDAMARYFIVQEVLDNTMTYYAEQIKQ